MTEIDNKQILEVCKQKECDEIMEGETPEGWYFKEEDGTQGFIPRAKSSNPFKLSNDQLMKKEQMLKHIMRDYPTIDEAIMDFAISSYLDNPEEFDAMIEKNKNDPEPSRYTKSIKDLKEKYGEPINSFQGTSEPKLTLSGLDTSFDLFEN